MFCSRIHLKKNTFTDRLTYIGAESRDRPTVTSKSRRRRLLEVTACMAISPSICPFLIPFSRPFFYTSPAVPVNPPKGLGSAVSSLAGLGGARPPNNFWCILMLKLMLHVKTVEECKFDRFLLSSYSVLCTHPFRSSGTIWRERMNLW